MKRKNQKKQTLPELLEHGQVELQKQIDIYYLKVNAGFATLQSQKQRSSMYEICSRLSAELNSIHTALEYLMDELKNDSSDYNKCFYHFDNFYHRIFVLEEMYYGLLSKVFFYISHEKDGLETHLNDLGYKDLKLLLSNFKKDSDIQNVRKRRRELVHRTGYSAEELFIKIQKTKIRAYAKRRLNIKTTKKNFCWNECRIMTNVWIKYINFLGELFTLVNKYTASARP